MNTSQVFTKWAVKDKDLVCLFWSWYIYHWIKPSGRKTKQKRTPLTFLFLYILMSSNSNISHWKGTCMQTSSFSFINDDLQIKPFGARSWHFPKQPMKSRGQGALVVASWRPPDSMEPSWRCILVKLSDSSQMEETTREEQGLERIRGRKIHVSRTEGKSAVVRTAPRGQGLCMPGVSSWAEVRTRVPGCLMETP